MECSTVQCGIEDYCCRLQFIKIKKSNKERRCSECRQIIPKGGIYIREVLKFEGKVWTQKTCPDCQSLREIFFKDGWIYGEILEMLEEHITECGGDVSESDLSKLTPTARAVVCEFVENTWKEGDDE